MLNIHSVEVNVEITKCVCISRHQSAGQSQNINIADKIKAVTKLTYLEVTITNQNYGIIVFWDVTLSSLVGIYQCLDESAASILMVEE